jgi:Ring finger domain
MSAIHECNICLQTIGAVNNCVTPCGHTFCFDCIMTSVAYKNTCPCCRTVICDDFEEDSDVDDSEDDDEDDYTQYDYQYDNVVVLDPGAYPLVIETYESLIDIIRRRGNFDYYIWIRGIIPLIDNQFEWETEQNEELSDTAEGIFRRSIAIFKRTRVLKDFIQKHITTIANLPRNPGEDDGSSGLGGDNPTG